MIELIHSEEFALKHITGRVLVHKSHKNNTFSAELDVNELIAPVYKNGFATKDAAEQWAWGVAEQEDNRIGEQ